jgi:hypothetical protein
VLRKAQPIKRLQVESVRFGEKPKPKAQNSKIALGFWILSFGF